MFAWKLATKQAVLLFSSSNKSVFDTLFDINFWWQVTNGFKNKLTNLFLVVTKSTKVLLAVTLTSPVNQFPPVCVNPHSKFHLMVHHDAWQLFALTWFYREISWFDFTDNARGTCTCAPSLDFPKSTGFFRCLLHGFNNVIEAVAVIFPSRAQGKPEVNQRQLQFASVFSWFVVVYVVSWFNSVFGGLIIRLFLVAFLYSMRRRIGKWLIIHV